MYKVLIVDNENLVGNTLRDFMDWGTIGCEVVGVVKNDAEAWGLYQEVRPQIILIDVTLFEDRAVTFIEKVKAQDKNCQCIIISEETDIEVVKRVMKAGAFEYLQKQDVIKETLVNCVKLAQMKINGSNNSLYYVDGAALDKLQQNLLLMQNGYVIEKDQFHEVLMSPVFEQYRKGCLLAGFNIHNIKDVYAGGHMNSKYVQSKLNEIIQECLPLYMKARVIFTSDHSGFVMFQTKEAIRVLNAANCIIRNLNEKMNVTISLLLSDVMQDFNGFYETYLAFIKDKDINFYVEDSSITQLSDIEQFHSLNYSELTHHMEILQNIKERKFQKIGLLQHELIQYMKQHHIFPNEVKNYFAFIFHNIEGNEMVSGVKRDYHFEEIFTLINQCETIHSLDNILSTCFQTITDWILDVRQNKYRQDIVDIIEFIQKHYRSKVTLKMIAENFNMNESYLSRMFKNETGKNVIYFVNELKMKTALELLSNPSVMVKEAACSVGMEDQFYFNKVFKKFYNMSPSDFRRKITSNKEN